MLKLHTGTLVSLQNKCPYKITAFARHGSSPTNSYSLKASTGFQQLNVGSNFPAGLIWGSKSGSNNNAEVAGSLYWCFCQCACTAAQLLAVASRLCTVSHKARPAVMATPLCSWVFAHPQCYAVVC